ncbi:MAG: hypothetical protein V1856_02240 [Candidatus Liptonbacteria bacterium]
MINRSSPGNWLRVNETTQVFPSTKWREALLEFAKEFEAEACHRVPDGASQIDLTIITDEFYQLLPSRHTSVTLRYVGRGRKSWEVFGLLNDIRPSEVSDPTVLRVQASPDEEAELLRYLRFFASNTGREALVIRAPLSCAVVFKNLWFVEKSDGTLQVRWEL